MVPRGEISSNRLVDGNPETLISNALYVSAAFQPFMMIGEPVWEVISL